MKKYQKPECEVVLLTAKTVMQGITYASGEQGEHVNPDPIDIPPGSELSNHSSIWDEEEEI